MRPPLAVMNHTAVGPVYPPLLKSWLIRNPFGYIYLDVRLPIIAAILCFDTLFNFYESRFLLYMLFGLEVILKCTLWGFSGILARLLCLIRSRTSKAAP